MALGAAGVALREDGVTLGAPGVASCAGCGIKCSWWAEILSRTKCDAFFSFFLKSFWIWLKRRGVKVKVILDVNYYY